MAGTAQGDPGKQADLAIELGEPPRFPDHDVNLIIIEDEVGAVPLAELDKFFYMPAIYYGSGALSVQPANRQESLIFYRQYFLTGSNEPGWTGNVASCNPGTTSQIFRDAVVKRINYFRAMAGVPAQVSLLDGYNQKAQKAALMMSANNALSHNPPTSWKCYTDQGHEAAGNSNIALGAYGLEAITLYMKDPGTGNSAVGHRRWILYPQTQNMGTGDIPGDGGYREANDLWVFDNHTWDARPATREVFVAWPPPGYVPYTVIYPRWSFSYAGANFDSATVSMTENGVNMPVTRYTPVNGYGENTLVWIRTGMNEWSSWPKPSSDTVFVVTVSNVMIGGSPRSFQYTVIAIDPG